MKKKICLSFVGVLGMLACHALGVTVSTTSLDTGGGITWKTKTQVSVTETGNQISTVGYNDVTGWQATIVPGTVFASYVGTQTTGIVNGLEPDPNYAANIQAVDATKYNQSYWYRSQFTIPASYAGNKIWLNFEGINRTGDVYFNGTLLGSLDGFMQRGKFDITSLATVGGTNAVAVLVKLSTSSQLANYASPTYLSSNGWDWMPAVPGRNTGITDNVFLSNSGQVVIVDPWIRTDLPLPATAPAALTVAVGLKNNATSSQTGVLSGVINPGNITFSQNVTLTAGQSTTVTLTPSSFPQLSVASPLLWWPNGYGAPNLYTCQLKFDIGGVNSDTVSRTFGIREYSYDTTGSVLHISVNGTRIFVRGGNWGMSEYMLRCRDDEYFLKLYLHQQMNMNMIRNWVGSTTDEEFYDACDQYGIMVWDDFWLNSAIGNPNVASFTHNANEKVIRLRNHPSIAIWCGMNEGTPDTTMNPIMVNAVATYDGNDRYYQANSHAGNLSGSGVWQALNPSGYFDATPVNGGGVTEDVWGFRSEMGVPVFTTFDTFTKFIPKANWWPSQNAMWNTHFFGSNATNANPANYESKMNARYGTSGGIWDYLKKAQLMAMESNKTMFEGFNHYMFNTSSGLLLWMSQSAYPSFVWQTYDYYYDLTGAFWGVKSACEPLHIQWTPVNLSTSAYNGIEIVNASNADANSVTAEAKVYNKDGTLVSPLNASATVSVPKGTVLKAFNVNFNYNNLAYGRVATASSGSPSLAVDGNTGTRWGATSTSATEWIYVDLGAIVPVSGVKLNWETAYASGYKIQTSNDAVTWTDRFSTTTGDGGVDTISFATVNARYVKMQGVTRGTMWGYSIWEFEVLRPDPVTLTDVHFLRLLLKNSSGTVLSDNFYWRGTTDLNYTGLNTLAPVSTSLKSTIGTPANGYTPVTATITNPPSAKAVAVANRVKLVNASTGQIVLPTLTSASYFSLLPGESKNVSLSVQTSLLNGAQPKVVVETYNQGGPSFLLVNKNSGKSVTVSATTTANGNVVYQWTYDYNSTAASFMFVPTENGDHFKILQTGSGKCLSIIGLSATDGADVELCTYTGGEPCQQWDMVDAGNGWFKIRNVGSGKYLEVDSSSTADGAVIQQWSATTGANQQWRLQAQGDFFIRSPHGTRYVTTLAGGTANGTKIVQTDYQNADAFKWRFESVGEGNYRVSSIAAPTRVIGVQGASTANSADCELSDYLAANTGDQKVQIHPLTNGRYKFNFVHDGKYWDNGNTTANNAHVTQYTGSTNAWQEFMLERAN